MLLAAAVLDRDNRGYGAACASTAHFRSAPLAIVIQHLMSIVLSSSLL
jgi:hypothetical protein